MKCCRPIAWDGVLSTARIGRDKECEFDRRAV